MLCYLCYSLLPYYRLLVRILETFWKHGCGYQINIIFTWKITDHNITKPYVLHNLIKYNDVTDTIQDITITAPLSVPRILQNVKYI